MIPAGVTVPCNEGDDACLAEKAETLDKLGNQIQPYDPEQGGVEQALAAVLATTAVFGAVQTVSKQTFHISNYPSHLPMAPMAR